MLLADQKAGEAIARLLKELGFENALEAEKEKVLELLASRFDRVVMTTLISFLPEEKKEELLDMLDRPDSEAQVSILAAGVPGFDQALEKALVEEYEAIKADMQAG